MKTTPTLPGRLIRLPEVKTLTGLSKTTIYRMVAAKTFPSFIKLGAKTTAWVESEVLRWMQETVNQQREAVAA